MSSRNHTSPYRPAYPSENRKRPASSGLTPIACRVCDEVFSDNLKLLFHFECHLQDRKTPIPWLSLSTNSSSYYSTLKNTDKRLRPLSLSSADVGLVDAPTLNSVPPMNSSLWHHRFTSPSRYPLMYPQMDAGRFAPWSTPAPWLHLRSGNGGSLCPSSYKNSCMKQLEKEAPEITAIGDDDEIDLTLKL